MLVEFKEVGKTVIVDLEEDYSLDMEVGNFNESLNEGLLEMADADMAIMQVEASLYLNEDYDDSEKVELMEAAKQGWWKTFRDWLTRTIKMIKDFIVGVYNKIKDAIFYTAAYINKNTDKVKALEGTHGKKAMANAKVKALTAKLQTLLKEFEKGPNRPKGKALKTEYAAMNSARGNTKGSAFTATLDDLEAIADEVHAIIGEVKGMTIMVKGDVEKNKKAVDGLLKNYKNTMAALEKLLKNSALTGDESAEDTKKHSDGVALIKKAAATALKFLNKALQIIKLKSDQCFYYAKALIALDKEKNPDNYKGDKSVMQNNSAGASLFEDALANLRG